MSNIDIRSTRSMSEKIDKKCSLFLCNPILIDIQKNELNSTGSRNVFFLDETKISISAHCECVT